jgi:hypothetical protein
MGHVAICTISDGSRDCNRGWFVNPHDLTPRDSDIDRCPVAQDLAIHAGLPGGIEPG